jgi:hypothetical protein
VCVYGLFLSINNASNANPMMMTMIMAMTDGTKYRSAVDGAAVEVGAAVAS